MSALFDAIATGAHTALSPANLIYCFGGVTLGTLIGILPGLGPIATISMLLPVTFYLPPESALITLAGIYYGAQYGGSTTAVLVNMPGESSSVVTCLDGYAMARQGRAGPALSIAAIASFFAGCVATLVIASFAPVLANFALEFGPAEYFALMLLGLVAAVVLASGSLVNAFAMIFLGLLFGTVGTDLNTGVERFTFGIPKLIDGVDFVTMSMGIFAISEIVVNLEGVQERTILKEKIGRLLPSAEDFKRSIWPILVARFHVGVRVVLYGITIIGLPWADPLFSARRTPEPCSTMCRAAARKGRGFRPAGRCGARDAARRPPPARRRAGPACRGGPAAGRAPPSDLPRRCGRDT